MPRSKAAKSDEAARKPEDGWRGVRREDLEDWAGEKALKRGEAYREEGRVEDLAVTDDGGLLATVSGTEDYATHAWLEGGRLPESMCSCPVGLSCKHAVATILEYLHALAEGREVPRADEDDPRWHDLDEPRAEAYDDESRPRRSRRATKAWDDRIREHLRALSQAELAEAVWSIANSVPEVYDALRHAVALRELDPAGLVSEARREIRAATSVDPWLDHWDGDGELPDYRPVERVLRRLMELGRADDVVALGRDLIAKGFPQVERAGDEGETGSRLRRCLAIVFEAVSKSSMPGPERLLFAIDAHLEDPAEVLGDADDPVFEPEPPPTDWAAVADSLLARLRALPPAKPPADYGARYRRDALADWAAEALERSGREDELPALVESEARATGDRGPFIQYLIDEGRLDDAEREAREALADEDGADLGAASRLAMTLADLAGRRGRRDVVAAHAARQFFDDPGVSTFGALMKAAAGAGVEPAVRDAAIQFLRSGRMPYAWGESKPRAKSGAGKRAIPAAPAGLRVDPSWPLPVPDEIVALLKHGDRFGAPRPRVGVLIEIALDEGDADAALGLYDALRADARKKSPILHESPDRHADRVAAAVAATRPDRALEIYKAQLDRALPIAEARAYERSAGLLARLRPIHDALGRLGEWDELVAAVRERYRNRPKFLRQLDRTLGPPS
ncbi:hypothetical protein [Paludisphaera sp.]|uniref:SWIM zinc finger family protein n=1 Tax=Paludisphaera sp. TaxID=2017432 RepID=UPI00301DB87A